MSRTWIWPSEPSPASASSWWTRNNSGGAHSEVVRLRKALHEALTSLGTLLDDAMAERFENALRELGLEPGWGRTASRSHHTLRLLSDVLEAPGPTRGEALLSRVPKITSIVVVSPHGYFGQSGMFGLPDTGGQVVYILDPARAVEKDLTARLYEQG